MADMQGIIDGLVAGKATQVQSLVLAALDEGTPAQDILNQGLVAGMGIVGQRFRQKEVFIPEVLIAARAMKVGMATIRPVLAAMPDAMIGKAVVGTVQGDLHDIGKNLIATMLEGSGIEVVDLGIDVSPGQFVEAVRNESAGLVCMSALLTTTMGGMKATIEALGAAGLKSRVRTLVGGAPVTASFAESIGADAFAGDAVTGAERAKALLAELRAA